MTGINSDNGAVLEGFTVEKMAESSDGMYSLHISHKPNADLEDVVRVFDRDEQEYITLNGWNWSFEVIEEPDHAFDTYPGA